MHRGVWTVVGQGRSTEWERAEQGYTVLASDDSIPNHPQDLRGMLLKQQKKKNHGKLRRSKGNGQQEARD